MPLAVARCAKDAQKFAMRFKQTSPNFWTTDWTFKIGELSSLNEESVGASEQLSGSIGLAPDYPGCPLCQRVSFFKCNKCGKLTCWSPDETMVTCQHCKVQSHIGPPGIYGLDAKTEG